jgi:hypothetical protein
MLVGAQDKPPEEKKKEPQVQPANLKIETRPGSMPRMYNVKISGTIEGLPENTVLTFTLKPIINRYERRDEDIYDEKAGPKPPSGPMPMPPDPKNPQAGPKPGEVPSGTQPQAQPPKTPVGPPKATLRTVQITTEPYYRRPLHFKVVVNKGKFEWEEELGPYAYDYIVRFFVDDQITNLGSAADSLTKFQRAGSFLVGDIKSMVETIKEDTIFMQNMVRESTKAVDMLLAGTKKEGAKVLVGAFLNVAKKEERLVLSASDAMFRGVTTEIMVGIRPHDPHHAPFSTPMEIFVRDQAKEGEDPKDNKQVEKQVKQIKDTDIEFSALHGQECYKVLAQVTQMILRETTVNGLILLRPNVEKIVAVAEEYAAADDQKKKDAAYWKGQLEPLTVAMTALTDLDNFMKTRSPFAEKYNELVTGGTKPDFASTIQEVQDMIQVIRTGIQSGQNLPGDLAKKAREKVLPALEKLEGELRTMKFMTLIEPKK